MTDSTAQHIAARDDPDLQARLIATAEQLHVPQPDFFVASNLGRLISTPIDGASTVTTAHAYAKGIRDDAIAQLPPPPGLNPAAVTDDQLVQAVQAVLEATGPSEG